MFKSKDLMLVESVMQSECPIYNVIDVENFIGMWPQFEASPKHKKIGYTMNGVYISPMSLSDNDAQAALLLSIDYQGERFVRFKSVIYRFLRTHMDRDIYHGFEIKSTECPISV
ncbi:hypothetical protein WYO_1817 [Methylobacterium sp. GXF4]|nr:hypothetical protein WYO_1817 [Methylobacterium sp. GXF4]